MGMIFGTCARLGAMSLGKSMIFGKWTHAGPRVHPASIPTEILCGAALPCFLFQEKQVPGVLQPKIGVSLILPEQCLTGLGYTGAD